MPLVSIITPTHNRAALLSAAIRSVLNQTLDDWELIIVDDGSTDRTAEVVGGIGDARIRYLRQEHGERSTARNRGIQAALGTYIAFLDDDDSYLPYKLVSEAAFLERRGDIDLVGGGTRLVDSHGTVLAAIQPWLFQSVPTLENFLLSRCRFLMCSVLFRRSVLARMDHWFDPELDIAEDADFFMRMTLAGAQAAWLFRIVSDYRCREGSLKVLFEYSAAFGKVLDKFFARQDLPESARALSARSYLNLYLFSACRAYAYRQVSFAQRELLRGLIVAPGLADVDASALFDAVGRAAGDGLSVSNPESYVDFVFDNLPAPLAHLRSHRSDGQLAYGHAQALVGATTIRVKTGEGD